MTVCHSLKRILNIFQEFRVNQKLLERLSPCYSIVDLNIRLQAENLIVNNVRTILLHVDAIC